MIIEYKLPQRKSTTNTYFTRYILSHLRRDILKTLNKEKIKIRLQYIEEQNLINYYEPQQLKITVDKFLQEVISSLEFKRFKNTYIIRMNPHKTLYNSSTPIDFLVRLVDKGDNNISGCYEFSKLFFKYQKNIYDYYRSFCLFKELSTLGVDKRGK